MKTLKNVLVVALIMLGTTLFAQTNLTGKVVDEYNQPLPGSDVIVEGTNDGASTDFDGNFNFTTSKSTGTVTISFMGYFSQSLDFNGSKDFGTIKMEASAESLDEIVIKGKGIMDIASERETPVAVSTIMASEIVDKLGSQELPELLNATPSVYATKQGGGYGDSRVNIRGFDSKNTAVMINGMPVNDMESGKVYWSNWAGLSDVTSAMQVQRGLGSSKLAISSVGGTINVITRTGDAREGGNFGATYGNDNFLKVTGSYSTGKMENGLSTSVLISQFQGDGYVDGTKFQGNTWFLGVGYEINDNNSIMLTATGAPQWHHQRYYAPNLNTYIKYGENGEPNRKYNGDWGYLDGEEFTFRRNFYHKPVASLNWDLKLDETANVSTVIYASWGRGGGTGPIGKINGGKDYKPQFKDEDGLFRFDDIQAWNSGATGIDFGSYSGDRVADTDGNYINNRGDGFTRRASMNSHDWYGVISNFHKDVNDNIGFDFGVDARTYKGMHYRIVNDDLGADGYFDNRDRNNPDRNITEYYEANPDWNPFVDIVGQQKIEYYNVGGVNWLGAFGQLEYKTEKISTFLQFGASQQAFQRTDYFNLGTVAHENNPDQSAEQTSDWEALLGGNIKTGLNYNINKNHNVFINGGYYSKQPMFSAVYPNYTNNDVNDKLTNETIIGIEVGYGYRAERTAINLNLYRTSWDDRFMSIGYTDPDTGDYGTARMDGINQLHMGIEADATYRPVNSLKLNGMISVGNWEYSGNPTGKAYDDDNNLVGTKVLYLDGVKVGDAAQFTSRLALEWKAFKNFTFDINQFMADHLYADINASGFGEEDNLGSLQLPSFSLTNTGMAYKFNIGEKMGLKLRVNVNNLWDHTYISESETNYIKDQSNFQMEDPNNAGEMIADENAYNEYLSTGLYQGVDKGNRVFFGFGRTWNASLRFNF